MRLVRQLAAYTISLKELEDNLLARLAASQVGGVLFKGQRQHAMEISPSPTSMTHALHLFIF